jgi:hypothetical protein
VTDEFLKMLWSIGLWGIDIQQIIPTADGITEIKRSTPVRMPQGYHVKSLWVERYASQGGVESFPVCSAAANASEGVWARRGRRFNCMAYPNESVEET